MLSDRPGGCVGHASKCLSMGLWTACAVALLARPCAVQAEDAAAERGQASVRTAFSSGAELPEGTLIGLTAPIRKATLAAVMPARIVRVAVDEGTSVNAGDIVVDLDSDVQRARVEIAKAAAESTLPVELAKNEWNEAQRDYDRFARLLSEASASDKEINDARSLAQIRRIEYELAVFNREQALRAYERERAVLDQHSIRAPFTGHVIEHLKHDGESVDQLEGIVTLVQLDPLLVTIDCPLALGDTISKGSGATVTPIGIARAPRIGRVTHVSPVADTGSQTIRVKLEVANGDGAWIAGSKVTVAFAMDSRARAVLAAHAKNEKTHDEPSTARPPRDHP